MRKKIRYVQDKNIFKPVIPGIGTVELFFNNTRCKCRNFTRVVLLSAFLLAPGLANAQLFSSVKSEKETGAKMARQVEQQIGLYENDKLVNYVRAIGNRLVSKLKNPKYEFNFNIVNQREPNAFALPAGYIYFSRGILHLANSEDDLAGVLGHEIIHVTERHSSKQADRGILPGLLQIPGKMVGAFVNKSLGNIINSPISFISEISSSSYSRRQESEADRLGLRLAADAGYNPVKLAGMLQQIERDVQMQTGHRSQFSFFNSHPMTPDRVYEINSEAHKVKWQDEPPLADGKEGFLMMLDGLVIGQDPAEGFFTGQQFTHPGLGFTITFPSGWKLINTPRAVGAFTEEQDGAIFIEGIGKAGNPEEIGKAYLKKLKDEYNIQPDSAEKATLNSFPAYYISILDESGREPAHFYYLWVTMGRLTYQLVGGGLDKYYKNLGETVFSLAPLSSSEKKNIKVIRLRVIEAVEGETLAELSARAGNVWSIKYTAMTNRLSENEKLNEGNLVKIAIEEPYINNK
jgi:predicted Zn-dependent protease